MPHQLAFILVGDHLGQVKKVLLPSSEITLLPDCATPDSSNPVVSIEPFPKQSKQLIANRNGELYVYDPIQDSVKSYKEGVAEINKALPISDKQVICISDKKVFLDGHKDEFAPKLKRGEFKDGKASGNLLGLVGKGIPLEIFDLETKKKTFEAEPPEKDWLGVRPDVYVNGLDFVGHNRIATCSKSDSVIRIYDVQAFKKKPVISINIDHTAFNEHADSARFISVASTGESGHSIVVGSNVGQMLAIDLRFNVKQLPKKRLQPRTYKVLGGFKGSRGGSIKAVKIATDVTGDQSDEPAIGNHKVISCCLDRYLRIHNFTRNSRHLDRHIYMTTKPYCCSPVFYEEPQ